MVEKLDKKFGKRTISLLKYLQFQQPQFVPGIGLTFLRGSRNL